MSFSMRLSQMDALPSIPKLEYGRTLGQGSFAIVKSASFKDDPAKLVAVKLIHKKYALKSGLSTSQVSREVNIQAYCSNHPNVTKLYDANEDPNWLYLIMELADNGDLFDKIEPDVGVDDTVAHFFFCQLLSAVRYIHGQGVAHRDIKPENILLDSRGNLKLADFGLACVFQKNGKKRLVNTPCGSPPYMAPEVAYSTTYDAELSDLWSCAILLYVLLSGQTPWDEPTEYDPDFANFLQQRGKLISGPWGKFSPSALSLLRAVLKPNPANRITVSDVMDHRWVMKENPLANPNDGLCQDSGLLTKKLLSNLNVGLDSEDKKYQSLLFSINNRENHQTNAPSTQPEMLGVIDDIWSNTKNKFAGSDRVFPATQQPLSEHSRQKTEVKLGESTPEDQIIRLVSKDPAILQFINQGQRPINTEDVFTADVGIFSERFTRFFSILDLENLVSILMESLTKIGVKGDQRLQTQQEKYLEFIPEDDQSVYIPIRAWDRRRMALVGNIRISQLIPNLTLRKVEFIKSKGDPLEWRLLFKTVTVLSKHAVYIETNL
ncbi:hypothetical protein LJB42_003298 [Komagataella kurtzmanii]|nr:hypothetical protein LJB42_003298 [Komagataella kurtzmanii]